MTNKIITKKNAAIPSVQRNEDEVRLESTKSGGTLAQKRDHVY